MRLKPASEAEGRRFNSCRARQNLCEKGPARNRRPLFCAFLGLIIPDYRLLIITVYTAHYRK